MIAAAAPIHETSICGVSVRWFAPPSGRPELPWHSVSDLHAAAGLPHDVRRDLLQRARAFPDGEFDTTPDGTLIESHNMAIGLIGAMIETGAVQPSFAADYERAGASVLEAILADLPPAERFARLMDIMEGKADG